MSFETIAQLAFGAVLGLLALIGIAAAFGNGAALRLLDRVVDVQPTEVRAMLVGCVYFFCVLASYFILRPIRDAMAVASGTREPAVAVRRDAQRDGAVPSRVFVARRALSRTALRVNDVWLLRDVPRRVLLRMAIGPQRNLDRAGVLHLDERLCPVQYVDLLERDGRHVPHVAGQAVVRLHRRGRHGWFDHGHGDHRLLRQESRQHQPAARLDGAAHRGVIARRDLPEGPAHRRRRDRRDRARTPEQADRRERLVRHPQRDAIVVHRRHRRLPAPLHPRLDGAVFRADRHHREGVQHA